MSSSTSPRKRLSLVAGNKFGAPSALGSAHASAQLDRAGGPLKPQRGSRSAAAAKAWPYAPRSAKERLLEIREGLSFTPAQLAQAINGQLTTDTSVNQQQLLSMEAGFAFVPATVLAAAERLHADHQAEVERQAAGREPAVLVGGEYPYQEPMEGPDYQIAPPRYLGGVGGHKAMSREARKDQLLYQPSKISTAKLTDYLEQAKAVLTRTDGPLQFSEEVALSILHDLRYNSEAALAALRHCVLWTQPPPPVEQTAAKPPGRAAAANSVLWHQRLREHQRHISWSDGEKEALDAGIREHGKELAVMHRAQRVLHEKTLPQLIEMYYVAGWRHQSP